MMRKAGIILYLLFALHMGSGFCAESSEKESAFTALLPHIQARIKAKELYVQMDVMGRNQRVQVMGADDKSLTVKSEGTDSPIPWRLVSADTVAALGKAASQESVPAALATVDYCIAAGQKETAKSVLDTAYTLDKDKKFEKELAERQERLTKGTAGPASGTSDKKPTPTPSNTPAFVAQESGEWPQPGYDGGNRFASPCSIKFPLVERWRYVKASPVRHIGGMITAKNKVVLSCVGEHNGDAKQGDPSDNPYILAFDLATGTKAWNYSPKNDWCIGCPMAYADGSAIFNDDGFGGVDVEKGTKTWGGGADSWGITNVDTKAGLIVKSCSMKVDNAGVGIDAFSIQGAFKWTALNEDGARMGLGMPFSSMCQGAGNVYASLHYSGAAKHANGLFAVAQATGKDVWKLDGDWGGVSFDGHFVYSVKKEDGKLYCLNPSDGTTKWSTSVGGPAQHAPGHGRGICIVITDAGVVVAFPTEGANAGKSLAWQSATAKPFTKDGLVLAGLRMGSAEVSDETRHTYRRAVLAIAEGAGTNGVAVIANGSSIVALDLKTGGGVWNSGWDEKTFGPANFPNIAGGCLIVCGKNGVVCFGPPK